MLSPDRASARSRRRPGCTRVVPLAPSKPVPVVAADPDIAAFL